MPGLPAGVVGVVGVLGRMMIVAALAFSSGVFSRRCSCFLAISAASELSTKSSSICSKGVPPPSPRLGSTSSPFPSSMRVPRTPLVGACESTTDESAYDCFALIRAGADVNSGGERNRWPLTWAAEGRRDGQFHACGRDLDKVKMLVAAGARINRVGGDHGGTALHMAARDDRPEIVQFLIDAGIDVDSLDCDEKTAYDRAREAGAERAAGAIASFDFGRAIQMAIAEARYDRGAGPRPPEGPSFDFRIE